MHSSDKHGANLRAAPRIKIFQPAEICRGGEVPRRVHLLNVSTGGALVHGDVAPAVGEEVELRCGVALGPARVRWRNGQKFGVAFAAPIGQAVIDALVRMRRGSETIC